MSLSQSGGAIPAHVPAELVIDFDLFNDKALQSELFGRLDKVRRSAPPVAFSPYNGGQWLAFRNKEIQTLFLDGKNFSTAFHNMGQGPALIPLGIDPPDHAPWRLLVLKFLGPAKIRFLEDVVRKKAQELIGGLTDRTGCDFVEAIAEPMPISIFMELMGLPEDGFAEFRQLAVTLMAADDLTDPEVLQRKGAAGARSIDILSTLVAERTAYPKDDWASEFLRETVEGRAIEPQEILGIFYNLFLGGLDTVTNAMAFGIHHLATNQALQAEIRADRSRIPALVDILLRRCAFVNTVRQAKHDVEFGGVHVKAGEFVWAITWSGSNEDGGETEGPRHLAFGSGHHMCVGMHLAKLELRIMYETWFDRIGQFSLAQDDEPNMTGGGVMHLKRLRLNLGPIAS